MLTNRGLQLLRACARGELVNDGAGAFAVNGVPVSRPEIEEILYSHVWNRGNRYTPSPAGYMTLAGQWRTAASWGWDDLDNSLRRDGRCLPEHAKPPVWMQKKAKKKKYVNRQKTVLFAGKFDPEPLEALPLFAHLSAGESAQPVSAAGAEYENAEIQAKNAIR